MKAKIEYTDGSIELVKVEQVAVITSSNKLEFIYGSFKEVGGNPLEVISRVTVDGEIIYDHMGKKENYKKEIV